MGVTAYVLLCAELPFELPEDEGDLEAAVSSMKLEFKQVRNDLKRTPSGWVGVNPGGTDER